MSQSILVLYMPVVHRGYLDLFHKYTGKVDALFLIGDELLTEFATLHREIRAVDPLIMRQIVEGFNIFPVVEILDPSNLQVLQSASEIITVSEHVTRRVVETYAPLAPVRYDTVFLRWEEGNVMAFKPVEYERESSNEFDRRMIAEANREAGKSSDWWRRVGAVVVRDGEIILRGFNHHVPYEHMPYVDGDPRDFIEAGKFSHFSNGLHAEDVIFGQVATVGISLQGTSVYQTVFPCPRCAKLWALGGIARCYFSTGHASLDGERIMKYYGVEIILVK